MKRLYVIADTEPKGCGNVQLTMNAYSLYMNIYYTLLLPPEHLMYILYLYTHIWCIRVHINIFFDHNNYWTLSSP